MQPETPQLLTATLTKDQWEFILEVLDMNPTTRIKGMANALLFPQLKAQLSTTESDSQPTPQDLIT